MTAVIALLKGQTWEQFEDVAFDRARSQGTPEAYAEYFSAFPQGRHADAARDAEAFARADLLWTVEAYADYIESYPIRTPRGESAAVGRRHWSEKSLSDGHSRLPGRRCANVPNVRRWSWRRRVGSGWAICEFWWWNGSERNTGS